MKKSEKLKQKLREALIEEMSPDVSCIRITFNAYNVVTEIKKETPPDNISCIGTVRNLRGEFIKPYRP